MEGRNLILLGSVQYPPLMEVLLMNCQIFQVITFFVVYNILAFVTLLSRHRYLSCKLSSASSTRATWINFNTLPQRLATTFVSDETDTRLPGFVSYVGKVSSFLSHLGSSDSLLSSVIR